MLELLTQKPVLPTAVSPSQKQTSDKSEASPTVNDDGQSFAQSLEQETRASLEPPANQNAIDGEVSQNQSLKKTTLEADVESEALLADTASDVSEGSQIDVVPASDFVTSVATKVDTAETSVVTEAQALPIQARKPVSDDDIESADVAQVELMPQQAPVASDARAQQDRTTEPKPGDRGHTKNVTETANQGQATALNSDDVQPTKDSDTRVALLENFENDVAADDAEPQIELQGVDAAMPPTSKGEIEVITAPQVAAASTPTTAATPNSKLESKAKSPSQPAVQPTTGPLSDAVQANANGAEMQADASVKRDLASAKKDLEIADTKAGNHENATKAGVSLDTAKPALFEATLNAQSSTTDTAIAIDLTKAPAPNTAAAKPLPEVIVQVPQQRADMAAKQVGLELAKQAKNGDTHFIVRMDPPELGKLDVRLTINKAGEVQANILVDRESTLDLLNRDARSLERSLSEGGLKMDQNALNLGLKNQDPKGSDLTQTASGLKGGSEIADGEDGADMPDNIDGATLAQIQISSGRPLDVVI